MRHPFPKARIAWIVVLGVMMVVLMVGGLAQMGDPYPLSRTAVLLDDQGLQVVNAVCPGDRLLYAELGQPGNQVVPPTLRWTVRGDAPMPARLPVGTTPDGMRETTRLFGELDDGMPLAVVVESQQLGRSISVDFRIRDLQAGQVFGSGGTYGSFAEFVTAMNDQVPCDDPTGDGAKRRVLSFVLRIEFGLFVVLAALVLVDVMGVRRRSRATMQ